MSALFRDILGIEAVTASLTANSKEGAISELARLIGRSSGTDSDAIRRVLGERERLASTGVGSGVAIPHGRLASLSGLRAALAIHRRGLHFDAIDGEPVHILVAIVGPDSDPSAHLRVLARASRILREAPLRSALLACTSDVELRDAFVAADAD